jgi:tetratricopeptide (TPR) repeat protein
MSGLVRLMACWRADLLRMLGLEAAALRVLDGLCGGAELDPAALSRRLHLLAQAGAWPAALADSRHVLALRPQEAASWFNHGFLLEKTERWSDACAAFGQATRLDPNLDRAWYGLGLMLIHLDRLREAVVALRQNTLLQPFSPQGWYLLARVHLDLQEPDAARQILHRLQSFDPRVAAQLARETQLDWPAAA